MANTTEISFNCEAAEILPNGKNLVTVTVSSPDVDSILEEMDSEDIAKYVRINMNVEDVFTQSDLDKWAESEGYIKATDND